MARILRLPVSAALALGLCAMAFPAGCGDPEPSRSSPERAAGHTVRAYIAALGARDGARLCALFEPGALSSLELPADGADCATSVEASIGHRDPGGIPWRSTRIARVRSIEVTGEEARVTVTIVTRFADRRESSIEDDIVYLRDRAGHWGIVKPSAAIYRAVGIADIPPEVISPP